MPKASQNSNHPSSSSDPLITNGTHPNVLKRNQVRFTSQYRRGSSLIVVHLSGMSSSMLIPIHLSGTQADDLISAADESW
jgi:hypothetical protein